MKVWTRLHIDVDYSPADSGPRSWYCERTSFDKKQLTRKGMKLPYDDPGGLFSSITLKRAEEEKVVLLYGDGEYVLDFEHTTRRLDQGGYNYTDFLLHAWIETMQKLPGPGED